MNKFLKYFSIKGSITAHEWIKTKVYLAITIIVVFTILPYILGRTTSMYSGLELYMTLIQAGPVFPVIGGLAAIFMTYDEVALVPIIFSMLLLGVFCWLEIVSTVKRAKALKINWILAILLLHVGYVLNFFALAIIDYFPQFFDGYYWMLLSFIIIIAIQYRVLGHNKR